MSRENLSRKYDLQTAWRTGDKKDSPLDYDIASCVGEGWYDILDALCADLVALGWRREVAQVKEKLGGLRFYIGSGSPEIYNRIGIAEDASEKTCETCGAPGTRCIPGGYWIKTTCAEHNKPEERP